MLKSEPPSEMAQTRATTKIVFPSFKRIKQFFEFNQKFPNKHWWLGKWSECLYFYILTLHHACSQWQGPSYHRPTTATVATHRRILLHFPPPPLHPIPRLANHSISHRNTHSCRPRLLCRLCPTMLTTHMLTPLLCHLKQSNRLVRSILCF